MCPQSVCRYVLSMDPLCIYLVYGFDRECHSGLSHLLPPGHARGVHLERGKHHGGPHRQDDRTQSGDPHMGVFQPADGLGQWKVGLGSVNLLGQWWVGLGSVNLLGQW